MNTENFVFFGKKRTGRAATVIENAFMLLSKTKKGEKHATVIYLYESFLKKFRLIAGDRVLIAFDEKNNLLALKRTLDLNGYILSKNSNSKNFDLALFTCAFIEKEFLNSTFNKTNYHSMMKKSFGDKAGSRAKFNEKFNEINLDFYKEELKKCIQQLP